MAKMLKLLGIGGKKEPPHPPKADYSGQKSSSVQDLCGKFPTSDRKCRSHTLSSSSSNIHSHHSFDCSGSPRHSKSLKRNGLSRAGSDRHSSAASGLPEVSTTEDQSGEGNPTPPRLLDDYSVPFDLKKQLQKNPGLIGGLDKSPEQENSDVQDVSDDDYSVPFEIKKLNREKKLRDQERAEREQKALAAKENTSSEQKEGREAAHCDIEKQCETGTDSATDIHVSDTCKENGTLDEKLKSDEEKVKTSVEEDTINKALTQIDEMPRPCEEEPGAAGGIATDPRPQQEYEQPWEWSKTSSILFAAGESNGVPSSPERDHLKLVTSNNEPDSEYENTKHDYVNAQIGAVAKSVPGEVTDRLATFQISQATETAMNSGYGGARPKEKCGHVMPKMKQHRGPADDGRIGNYEEPWDLSNTQNILEEAFLANKLPLPAGDETSPGKEEAILPDPGTTANGVERRRVQTEGGMAGAGEPVTQHPDTRPQEGYEKPWDWKPHKKDDREQEGYEKPWDWKPHQKDQRPMEEYDQPWDQRAKNIEQNLVKAKSAKEIKGCASTSQESPGCQQSSQGSHTHVDTRPMDEYDMPWDQKMAAALAAAAAGNIPVSRTASDPSQVPQHSSVLHTAKSPAKRHQSQPVQAKVNIEPGWSPVAERIDPIRPLEKQGWYHGAISRGDAERLLRIHKEGSFLVRMSESNKRDFSLSLKSARGFMHMKIVYKGGNFILGQFSQPFESIPKMICHYSLNKLPIKGAEHMSLFYPVLNELL